MEIARKFSDTMFSTTVENILTVYFIEMKQLFNESL